jgi:hypothetical protein
MNTVAIAIPGYEAERLAGQARHLNRPQRQMAGAMLLWAIKKTTKTPKEWASNERREAVSQ